MFSCPHFSLLGHIEPDSVVSRDPKYRGCGSPRGASTSVRMPSVLRVCCPVWHSGFLFVSPFSVQSRGCREHYVQEGSERIECGSNWDSFFFLFLQRMSKEVRVSKYFHLLVRKTERVGCCMAESKHQFLLTGVRAPGTLLSENFPLCDRTLAHSISVEITQLRVGRGAPAAGLPTWTGPSFTRMSPCVLGKQSLHDTYNSTHGLLSPQRTSYPVWGAAAQTRDGSIQGCRNDGPSSLL